MASSLRIALLLPEGSDLWWNALGAVIGLAALGLLVAVIWFVAVRRSRPRGADDQRTR